MSRARLSDLLLKKKQANPKVAVRPAKKAEPVTIEEALAASSLKEEVPELSVKAETPASVPAAAVVSESEMFYDQEAEPAAETPARKTTSRRTVGTAESSKSEPLNKQVIIKLLKTSEVQSISSDVIDAVKEVLTTLIKDLVQFGGQGVISNDRLNAYVLKFVNDIDRDIPSSTVIPPANFEMFARSVFEEQGSGLNRNTYYYFQQFAEWIVVRLMSKADMVAGVAKRSRVTSVDLLVALHIYLE